LIVDANTFFARAVPAARVAQHIFPEYAACEAALESAWGASELALRANNLFGQKQSSPPSGASLSLPTREFLEGTWTVVPAEWRLFTDWAASFAHRMDLLRRMSPRWPHYQQALTAGTGEAFITAVSKTWSTDPGRAAKVLSIYRQHFPLPVDVAV
jgi:flagellum-specific peptidoglycan hydrolase FlgJ